MSKLPTLPTHLARQGDFSLSVHPFSYPESPNNERPKVEILLCSERNKSGHVIRGISVLSYGQLKLNRKSKWALSVEGKEAEWGREQFRLFLSSASIEPASVYSTFAKDVAKNLLSGHLMACIFYPLLSRKAQGQHLDLGSLWDTEYKNLLGASELSLTKFTAQNYRALTDWLDSSPAQVLASIEGVSVTTIRNRIHSARESGFIGKPGSGKRSAKSSSQ